MLTEQLRDARGAEGFAVLTSRPTDRNKPTDPPGTLRRTVPSPHQFGFGAQGGTRSVIDRMLDASAVLGAP